MRINTLIEEAWAKQGMKFTPRILASYSYAIMNGLIRQWLEPRPPSVWERPSGMYCARMKAYLKHGHPSNPLTAKTVRNFWLGDIYEATFVALALAAGAPIKYGLSSQLAVNTVWGEGHPDGVIEWDDPLTEVLEVKKMAPWPSYNKFKKETFSIADLDNTFGYRNQICMYVDAMIQEAIIPAEGNIRYVAINSANMEICERELVYDPDTVAWCRAANLAVNACSSPFEVEGLDPEPELRKGVPTGKLKAPAPCRISCSWPASCWEERGYRIDGDFLTKL